MLHLGNKDSTHQSNSYLKLHTAILLAGGTGVFGRLITIGELPLVCIRVVVASLILTIILAAGNKLHRIPHTDIWKIMGCGVLLSIHWVFFYRSIKAANVSIGVICFALVGFFTAIIEPLILRHRPSWHEILLSLLTVTGIGLIFGFDPQHRTGIVLGVISSILYTFFSIGSKRTQTSTGHSSSTMLLYELIGGGIILLLLLPFYTIIFPEVVIIPKIQDILYLLLFASVFTILPFLLQLQALRTISAFTVNLSYNLEPLYTILIAMILFDEANELNYSFLIGLILIIMSVVIQTVVASKRKQIIR